MMTRFLLFHQTQDTTPGPVGVRLFFVLSGYLITGILIGASDMPESQPRHILTAFYARHAVRILPLAYVIVGIACLVNLPGARAHWLWYDAYLVNWRVAATQQFEPGLAPFWSLAVEEQFYLVWPALLLWLPRRARVRLMIGAILLATICRALLAGHPLTAYVATVTRIDAFAVGGLLALGYRASWRWTLGGAVLLGLALIGPARVGITLGETGAILLSACVVDAAQRRYLPWLQWRPCVWIGGLSYGLYAWHAVLMEGISMLDRAFDVWLREPGTVIWRLCYMLAITIPVAWASARLFERRLTDWKRYFPYVRPASPQRETLRPPSTRSDPAPSNNKPFLHPGAPPPPLTGLNDYMTDVIPAATEPVQVGLTAAAVDGTK